MLSNDVMILIGLELDWVNLKSYSLTCKKINTICNSKFFWYNKIKKEYDNIDIFNVKEHKKLYYYLSRRLKNESKIDFIFGYTVFQFFPSYSPNYYLPHTNILKIEYRKMQEIYNNLKGFDSYVIGKFSEIYKVLFRTNEPETFLKDIKVSKNLTYASRVRFIDGIIVINLQDTFQHVF